MWGFKSKTHVQHLSCTFGTSSSSYFQTEGKKGQTMCLKITSPFCFYQHLSSCHKNSVLITQIFCIMESRFMFKLGKHQTQ